MLRIFAGLVILGGVLTGTPLWAAAAGAGPAPYGISDYHAPQAWLRMPHALGGRLPKLLSQTGAFADLATLAPAPGLIPYDLVVPFWSDGATKVRLMALPKGRRIGFSAETDWTFPGGHGVREDL